MGKPDATGWAHAQFEAHARHAPDRIAVRFQDEELSYGELDRRANQLAQLLRARGVRPEARVALCLERSLDMIVAVLATLKSGGAFVPLDPTYPPERLRFMLDDARAALVISHAPSRSALPDTTSGVLDLDTDRASIAAQSTDAPQVTIDGQNLAYVIYTSGSTGRPKGTLCHHAGLCNLAENQIRMFGVGPSSRTLQFSSFSFDASVSEMFVALGSGGTLVLATATMLAGDQLVATLRRYEITCVTLPPSVLSVLGDANLPALSTIVSAGEACTPALAQRWSSGRRFLNAYGPTESTVCATYATYVAGERVTIGHALENISVHVVDEGGALVTRGVGELYIAGAGLARGYHGRAALTAERFVPDPFSRVPGARMYRTGDLVERLEDGSLAFIGRVDDQVKLRGFRIELGEIEVVLNEQPSVRQAVVAVRTAAGTDPRLVGYVIPAGAAFDSSAVLAAVAQRLPAHMVPSTLVVVDGFKLTPAGKVDRDALPMPVWARADQYVAPRNRVEASLVDIWQQALALPRVGVEDNFFALGGHSLLGVRVVMRIREVLGVQVPLHALLAARTISTLAAELERIGRAKRPPILPVGRDRELPLSFGQERMWLLDKLDPGQNAYNESMAWQLAGAVDIALLEKCFNALVGRHELLRTTYVEERGVPRQVIHRELPIKLAVVDVQTGSQDLRRLMTAEAKRPFDLKTGPLIRVTVFRGGDDSAWLLLTGHHVVLDGVTLGVWSRELGTLYAALSRGEPSPLAPPALQYADYAVWQRAALDSDVLDGQLAYWKRQLQGAPAIELPTDRPRPAKLSYDGERLPFVLSRELSDSLKQLAKHETATPFMVLLAAFKVLLHRYTGQSDISVGTPTVGRDTSELADMVGYFSNTLVIRTDVTGLTFRELVARVKESALAAYSRQDVPFQKLVEALQPERSQNRAPLFQVMLAEYDRDNWQLHLPGIAVTPMPAVIGIEKLDLQMIVWEDAGAIVGTISYPTDLFDAATIEQMRQHFVRLVAEAIASPDTPIATLDLSVRPRMPVDDFAASSSCVHDLFAEQVARSPDAIAVEHAGRSLTYAELDRRANELAHYLTSLGVGPDVAVGLCAERSPDMLVGMLGVMKAGGCYVPLDPGYPSERLLYMLEDSKARVLLTLGKALPFAPPQHTRVVRLEDKLPAAPSGPPSSGVCAENLAYIIYTSGSTGLPKGVAISHRSPVAYLVWASSHFSREELRVSLGSTSVSFDVSVFELFTTLISGGKIVLVGSVLDLTMSAEPVTWINSVPTAVAELVEQNKVPGSVQTIDLAGEPVSRALVNRLYALPHIKRVVNLYGPTETGYTTAVDVAKGTDEPVHVGQPLPGVRVYVLAPDGQPVPTGVIGELSAAGVGVARGYVNQPARTAERFVPDPFGPPGSRMYRTGDLARWRRDGSLDLLGRSDSQVKIRGYRIELGEIENALVSHSSVTAGVVVVKRPPDREAELVAYVAPREVNVHTLREHLLRTLPEYMIPAVVMTLDALPVTPNGKIDRAALPEPSAEPALDPSGYVAPRTALEEVVAAIWREKLEVERVGVHDDFFELGGHSLLAVRVIGQIAELFDVTVPISTFFSASTVEGLAVELANMLAPGRAEELAHSILEASAEEAT